MAEDKFEQALIDRLSGQNGFKSEGWAYNSELSGVTSDKLYDHWRDILNQNNMDRLQGTPLTDEEFGRLRQELNKIKTPYDAQLILTGAGGVGSLPLNRDDGTQVEMDIFYGDEVAGGRSRYEIVNQITFTDLNSSLTQKRRVDILMLINGLPVAHIEEKDETLQDQWRAFEQLKKYADSGMYTGLFSFVQIQFILSQHSAHYFARPKDTASYNPEFVFGWRGDDGKDVSDAMSFLHQVMGIPALHRLVTVNMIPDASNDNLMVMRSYQIQATRAILDRMREMENNQMVEREGGYIWHTTGSGKTVTSFKVAQLLATMPRVEDVLFIVDRVDLVNQTYDNFRSYAYSYMENRIKNVRSRELKKELSANHAHANIYMITVQGLDSMVRDGKFTLDKRMVILMDEAHRSASGDSVARIKKSFKNTTWFGFTGTPNFYSDEVRDVKTTRDISTADIFGKRLHQYTIKDAIGDRNVLGFDVSYMKPNIVADNSNLSDDDLEREIYGSLPFRKEVVQDIIANWDDNASGPVEANYREKNMFHGMLAVSGKQAVVAYYKLFKEMSNLRVAMTYSRDDDNGQGDAELQAELKQAMLDYSAMYDTKNFLDTKEPEREYLNDLTRRIAHKWPAYRDPEKDRLDLVIVSDQLLTGFDSKYVNIIYMDKLLREGLLIQAMSRTNRTINRAAKPYGKVRFFRKGELMEENVKNALVIYTKGGNDTLADAEKQPSADDQAELFNDDILAPAKSKQIADLIPSIERLKELAGDDFSQMPRSERDQLEFSKLAKGVNSKVQQLVQQGYMLGSETPVLDDQGHETGETISLNIDSDEQFGAFQARWNDINQILPPEQQLDLTNISVALEMFAEERIDYDKLVDLLNNYIDERSAENSAAIDDHIGPMEADEKQTIESIKDDITNGERTEHFDVESLKTERKKKQGIVIDNKIYKWAADQNYNANDVMAAYALYRPGLGLNDNPKLSDKVEEIKDANNIGFFEAADFEEALMLFFNSL